MKFLHLGDIHLGKSLGDFDLIDDQEYMLKQICDMAAANKVDGILIAGDVYDKSIPSEAAVNLLDSFLKMLADRNIKAFLISGNHDSDDRLNFGSALFESRGIYISSVFDGKLFSRTFTDEYGELTVHMLPYVKASQVRHFYPDETIENYDDAVKAVIRNAGIDTSGRNLIISHQFVTAKGEKPRFGGSESNAVQNVGTVEVIGSDCYDDFDYAALGHIHSPQAVGREEVRYSGSMLKYSLSEVNSEKSVPMITFEEKGSVKIELLPLVPKRNLRRIKGELKKLLSPENLTDTEDYIYAILTDEEIVNNSMGILQNYYPHTVKVEFENSHTKALSEDGSFEYEETKSFDEIITEFYKSIFGVEISEDEMKIMKEVAEEAGVINEAN